MDPARMIAMALVAGLALWGLAVTAVRVDAWWRRRQADKAMDEAVSRLRCTPACREGHTWIWPCERSPMADRRGRAP